MRRRIAALSSILIALVAITLVSAGSATAAVMCPYTVSQNTYTHQSPSSSSARTGLLQSGTIYYFSSPLVTSGGWVKYRTSRWVAPGLVHRYNGLCLE